jgi:hypothetical protein
MPREKGRLRKNLEKTLVYRSAWSLAESQPTTIKIATKTSNL